MNNLNDIAQECMTLVRSGYPILYLYSWEEDRVQSMCEALAKGLKKEIFVWTSTEGLFASKGGVKKDSQDPLNMIRAIQGETKPALFLLKDFHPYLKDPLVVRALRSTLSCLRRHKQSILIVGPTLAIPRELEKEIYVVDIPLPSQSEIHSFLEQFFNKNSAEKKPSHGDLDALIRSAQGLTFLEMQRVFSRFHLSKNGHGFETAVDFINQEKSQILRQSRSLEFQSEVEELTHVGGLDQLKNWLQQRSKAFSEEARNFGLPQPKGLFLLGVQGCGKSLMAKAAAGYWRLPLLRMDVASLVSQSSGSEPVNLMVDALKIADSLAPVVLWLDEIEKAFSGVQKDGHLARNFGAFITWMQEKKSSVFVVATANFVQNLPPELLRKGRFDEIFFVDLPNIHERKEIFQIHLKNRGRKAEQFPIEDLAIKSEGYSGAEIEQVIIDGMFIAFGESRDLEPRDILESLDETVPLSTTMEESIKDLKEWANTRARRASTDTKRIDYFK